MLSAILGSGGSGGLGGLGALLGGLGGLLGGGGNTPLYNPGAIHDADTAYQNAFNAINQLSASGAGTISPMLGQMLAALQQVPTQGLTQAGQQAGQYYGGLAGQADQMHNILASLYPNFQQGQQNLMGAGNQLWQTALDPQQALQNRLKQQVIDQSRSATSARGIGMSPQAAGMETGAVSNFLQDWQNQQLARQLAGLQGMTGAYGQAGQQGLDVGKILSGSLEMGGLAPQFLQQSAQVPFNMATQAAGFPAQIANLYGQGMQNVYDPYTLLANVAGGYMGRGLAGAGLNFAQNQANAGNLSELGALGGNLLGNINWGQLGSMFNQPTYGPSSTSGMDSGYGFGGG